MYFDERGNGDRGQHADDGDDDHELDQREAARFPHANIVIQDTRTCCNEVYGSRTGGRWASRSTMALARARPVDEDERLDALAGSTSMTPTRRFLRSSGDIVSHLGSVDASRSATCPRRCPLVSCSVPAPRRRDRSRSRCRAARTRRRRRARRAPPTARREPRAPWLAARSASRPCCFVPRRRLGAALRRFSASRTICCCLLASPVPRRQRLHLVDGLRRSRAAAMPSASRSRICSPRGIADSACGTRTLHAELLFVRLEDEQRRRHVLGASAPAAASGSSRSARAGTRPRARSRSDRRVDHAAHRLARRPPATTRLLDRHIVSASMRTRRFAATASADSIVGGIFGQLDEMRCQLLVTFAACCRPI